MVFFSRLRYIQNLLNMRPKANLKREDIKERFDWFKDVLEGKNSGIKQSF